MVKKIRLDSLLVEKGFFENRSRARGAIMAGLVYVAGQRVDKAGTLVSRDKELQYRQGIPYVSRGGLKLEKALSSFAIDPKGLKALDIGASTGGFTHCLLQRGASLVYAVDVGYNQIHSSLRDHPQVVLLEKVNARYLKKEDLPSPFPLITIDVSFISLRLILPPLKELLHKDGHMITLIKPQFEVGKGRVGKGGVVRDPLLHQEILFQLIHFSEGLGLVPGGVTYSPIFGKKEQNLEYFLLLKERGEKLHLSSTIQEIVDSAHRRLDKLKG